MHGTWWWLLTEDGDVGGGVVLADVADGAAEILAGVRRQQAINVQLKPTWGRPSHRHVAVLLTTQRSVRTKRRILPSTPVRTSPLITWNFSAEQF